MGDMQNSQVQIDHYKEVETMVKMLRQSLERSNCKLLLESRLFTTYSKITNKDCPKLKLEDLETCRTYFAKIAAIGAESLELSEKVILLSNQFMTGVSNVFSENPEHADTAARHSGLLLGFSG